MAETRPGNYPKLKNYTPTRFMLPTSHYDKAKADRAVKFIEMLRHTKGKWAGKRFWLLPWQEQIIRDVFGVVKEDGKRQFRTAFVEISKKNGKQLDIRTVIPTPDGFTTMGDLKIGDTVFDENGRPCRVVAKSEVDDTEQAYRLTFRDGTSIVAGERHLWDCESIYGKRKAVEWTTGEIYQRTQEHGLKTTRKNCSVIRIPVCGALQTQEADLPVDPYAYGYWLGNGCATKPELTVRTCDVEDVISFIPYKVHNRYPQECGGSEILVYRELKKILVPSFRDKVIRPEYLRASVPQRWALLQGLMDSDGCIGERKAQSVYVSTIRQLAESVRELLWSLGIKNAMCETPSTRYGIPTGETLYQIRFTTFDDQPVSRLQRKISRSRKRGKPTRSSFHYLEDIQPLKERVQMQCIQVDSPSHQYLAGSSMVPTHNSELAAAVALYLLYADNEPSAEVYGAAADRQQASIVMDVASQMVQMTPALMKRSKIMTATKRIVNYSNSGFYQVLSAEVGCVAPETVLQREDGTTCRADEVRAGDRILAWDGEKPVFDEVASVREEDPAPVVAVRTEQGCRTVVTANHPFWCRKLGDTQYDWIPAEELQPGDPVATAGEPDTVVSVLELPSRKTISLEMKTFQTHVTDGLITHNTKHGLNVSGLVFDEVHAQPNRHLYDVLTKGSGDAREQPLYFLITTAGTDRESICYELHQKALDILQGRKIDPTFYPVVYGLADDDDWTDEKNWYKANPSLGQTIQIERVREMFQEAVDNPAEENVFKQLRLNMWVSSLTRFIPEQVYDKGNIPIDPESLKGRDCYGGLDLSSTGDITAFVLMFPPRTEQEKYILLPFFWIPEETIPLRVRRASVPYDVWRQQGYLNATEGNVIHYGFIEKFIEDLGRVYHIREIAFDRWGATQMVQDLEGMGFTVVPFGQGYKDMSPPTKEFYKLLMEGRIIHGGNPVMRWMAGNVVVDTDPAGNIKPTKAKSPEKIDGIVAAIMALDRCIRHEEQGSVYDDPEHGLWVF